MRKQDKKTGRLPTEKLRIRANGIDYFFSDEKELDEYLKQKVADGELDTDHKNLVEAKLIRHISRMKLKLSRS